MYTLLKEMAADDPQFEQQLFKMLTYYSGWCMFILSSNVLQVPLEVMGAGLLKPKHGVFVKFEPRRSS